MARFNTPTRTRSLTTNYEGAPAYKETPKLEFASILLTSFVQDQFYRSAGDTMDQVVNLLGSIDPKFAAKAAIFTRNEFGMRSISHVVAAELAHMIKGHKWTKNFFREVVRRPDDMTEIMAYYLAKYGKPIPNSLKKGFAAAVYKWDEYQLAKYQGKKKDVSLVDVINLITGKHSDALDYEPISKLTRGELKAADTWETGLTKAGQEAEDEVDKRERKAETWEKLINTRKLGYFALLRNLRNIMDQAPHMLDAALDMLLDEKLIRKSLLLPFRFVTAHDEMQNIGISEARAVLVALNKALDISCANVPKLSGDTLVALDQSGSMRGQPAKIGSLFAAVLCKSNDADLLVFSDDARYLGYNPMDSVLTIANSVRMAGGGTNFHSIFDRAKKAYDRIVILSDMQGWMRRDRSWGISTGTPTKTFAEYKNRFGCNPWVYSFDLQGYGTLQLPEPNVYCLAGFSEKIFDIMELLEQDRKALVKRIEAVEL